MSVPNRVMPERAEESPAAHVGELKNFVGGEFVSGDRHFDDINPADGSLIARVAEASSEIVDAAVKAGHRALRGEWGSSGVRQRAALLYKIADGIEARFDEFVQAESADTGKPVALASRLDVPRAAANFRVFADLIKTASIEAFETETPDGKQALNYAVRKPIGVVGIVTPWNLPLLLLTWKVAPALACGNAVVVKPSEETPASATLLAEVMRDAGVPSGVFNLVHGFGEGSAGEHLVSHPGINAVTFTGESRTGAAIMKACAPGVKPVSFELGGKNPAIIFADCDRDETIQQMSDAVFLNTGQVCLCAERVYVERPIYDWFVLAMKQKAESLQRRLACRQSDESGTAHLCGASRKSAIVLSRGARAGSYHCHRRRRSRIRRRARQRVLRSTYDSDRPAGVVLLRERGDLRAGMPRCSVRLGRRSSRDGERY